MTSTVTSVVSTDTACYATTGITAVCAKKKKKRAIDAIDSSPIDGDSLEVHDEIMPSSAHRQHKAMDLTVEEGQQVYYFTRVAKWNHLILFREKQEKNHDFF